MKTFGKIVLGSTIGFVIASIIVTALSLGLVGMLASAFSETPSKPGRGTILRISFATPVAEQGSEKFNFDPATGSASIVFTSSLYKTLRAIDEAASDPNISFIYMTPDFPAVTISQAEEIRDALKRFRRSGKAVVSYCNRMYDDSYYLASVADKVMFNPAGEVFLTGMSIPVIFFKDALDKLGIDVTLIRHGKYKSAGEAFVRSSISDENLEQNQSMVNSLWSCRADDVAASRDFSKEEFNRWIDNLELYDADALLNHGLVDQLCHRDELEKYLCSISGVTDAKKLKFIDIEDYAEVVEAQREYSRNKIAVVYCDGEIMVEEGMDGIVSGRATAATLEKLRRDSTVKAVVLRVNSPGGSSLGAEIINHELGNLMEAKPVIASFGDYAASGGYWISARADKIFTDRTSLTGSVGVFSIIPAFGNALKSKLGVNVTSIKSNRHSDILSLMEPLDKEEEASMQKCVEKVYTDFTNLVSEGRSMSASEVDSLGQGRIWTGAQAVEIGFADACGGIVDAINYAEAVSGLTDGNYRIVEYPAVKSAAERIMESFSSMKAAVRGGVAMTPFEAAYSRLRKSSTTQIYARMPYIYIF